MVQSGALAACSARLNDSGSQLFGQCEHKRTPSAGGGFYPNPATMQLDDFFTMGQPNTRSLIITAFMQSFEDRENTFLVFFLTQLNDLC